MKIISVLLTVVFIITCNIPCALSFEKETSLIGCWDFNEGSGNVISDSSNSNIAGTLNNGVWEDGFVRFHKADGGGVDFVKQLGQAMNGAKGITISAWVSNNDIISGFSSIFSSYIQRIRAGLQLWISNDRIMIGGRSRYEDAFQQKEYPLKLYGEWLHIVGVADYVNKTYRVYLNGVELMSTSGSPDVNFGSNTYFLGNDVQVNDTIGCDSRKVSTFSGMIDRVELYKEALSDNDVSALYNSNVANGHPMTKRAAQREVIQKANDKLAGRVALFINKPDVVFSYGNSKINSNNLNVTPIKKDGVIYIPVSVLKYFNIDTNYNGECEYIEGEKLISKEQFSIILGQQITVFDNGLIVMGADIENDVLDELTDYFTNKPYCLPSKDNYSSRAVVDYILPSKGMYVGSPSIIRIDNDTIIATHDYFGNSSSLGLAEDVHQVTGVFRSKDNGATWERVAMINHLHYATLFEQDGTLYLFGCGKNSKMTIVKSVDKGITWTEAKDESSGLFSGKQWVSSSHCAPTPILKAKGRVYKAFEDVDANSWPSSYKAYIMSAPDNSDLLNCNNWTMSDSVAFDASLLPEGVISRNAGWLEGNVVATQDGEIWNIIRVNTEPSYDIAAILKLSSDNETLTFDKDDFIKFPGGMSKFSIKFDHKTNKYISLVNEITNKDYPQARNVVSLSVSDDLINWEITDRIICDETLINWEDSAVQNGMQYVDWVIDGNDLLLAVRESANGAANYHDANYLTFYRYKSFRDSINNKDNSIIASFDFETINDITGNGNDIICTNAVKTAGKYGNTIDYGTGKISAGLLLKQLVKSNGISFSAFVKLKENSRITETTPVFVIYTANGNAIDINLESGNRLRVGGRSCASDSYSHLTVPNVFNDNEWHHIVGVMDYIKKSITVYYDGEVYGTFSTPWKKSYLSMNVKENSDDIIGNDKILTDEIRIYNRPLSAYEVKTMQKPFYAETKMYKGDEEITDLESCCVTVKSKLINNTGANIALNVFNSFYSSEKLKYVLIQPITIEMGHLPFGFTNEFNIENGMTMKLLFWNGMVPLDNKYERVVIK